MTFFRRQISWVATLVTLILILAGPHWAAAEEAASPPAERVVETPKTESTDVNEAELLRSGEAGRHIPVLQWHEQHVTVNFEDKTVRLRGRLTEEGWHLVREKLPIPATASELELVVSLTGVETGVDLLAIGPNGEVEQENLIIRYKAFGKEAELLEQGHLLRRVNLAASLGYTFLRYFQPKTQDYSMQALTAKFAASYPIRGTPWDVAFNTFFTAMPLSGSHNDVSARFLGVNLRAGYRLPMPARPWRISIQGGFYYSTMFVTGNRFGYQHLVWPQIYPSVRRELTKRDSVFAYLKWAPMLDKLKILNPLSNRELALGAGWLRELPSGRPLSAQLDIADMRLSVLGIRTLSTTLSVGMGL